MLQTTAQVGHYHNALFSFLRELRFYLEGADAFHLVSKEVYTERKLRGEEKTSIMLPRTAYCPGS